MTSHSRPSSIRRLSVSLAAVLATGALPFAVGSQAHGQACNLGQACNFDLTQQVDFPGLGSVTRVDNVSVDLTDLKANGSGEVTVATPGATVTSDTDQKDFRVSKGKGKARQDFKANKNKKNFGVKVKKSKNRRGA